MKKSDITFKSIVWLNKGILKSRTSNESGLAVVVDMVELENVSEVPHFCTEIYVYELGSNLVETFGYKMIIIMPNICPPMNNKPVEVASGIG